MGSVTMAGMAGMEAFTEPFRRIAEALFPTWEWSLAYDKVTELVCVRGTTNGRPWESFITTKVLLALPPGALVKRVMCSMVNEAIRTICDEASADLPGPPAEPTTWPTTAQSVASSVIAHMFLPGPPQHSALAALPPVVADLEKLQPNLTAIVACPAPECSALEAGEISFPLYRIVVHLNDYHSWDRTRIADWLDTLDLDLCMNNAAASGD